MATYELRPLTLGEILDTAFAVYRRLFGTLSTLALACIGVPMLLMFALGVVSAGTAHPWLSFGVYCLYLVGGILLEGAVVWAVSDAYLGREATAGRALAAAYADFGGIFIAGLGRNLLIGLGMILLIIPGIVAACGLSVTIPAVVLEPDTLGSGALSRSWELTKGYRWTALVLGLVTFVLYAIPTFATELSAAFVPFATPFVVIIGLIVQLLVVPGAICVFTLFYYDLRVRKEGFDLEQLSLHLGDAGAPALA